MRGRMLMPLVLSLAAVTCAMANAAEPALSKQRFESIVANLDTGGDLLVVANLEGYVQGLVSNITKFAMALPQTGPASEDIQAAFARIPGFLSKNGFYAVQGFGASVVPRADGLNTVKVFLCRDPAAAGSPLWRGLVGGQPRNLECAGFLPADTVLARTGTAEWPQLWKLVRSGVAEFATPEGAASFNLQLSTLSTNMGVDLDKVFASLGAEGFFSLQLSRVSTIEIPSQGGASVRMPCPSLLIGLAVKDDTLVKAIERPMARSKIPVVKTQVGSTTISSITVQNKSPFPFQPSFAIYSNVFLIGSTTEVVSDAIKAFKGSSGLVATAEYRKAFQGLPAANNGIFYMSPRLMKAVMELQASMTASGGEEGGGPPAFLGEMLSAGGDLQSAFVIQNLPAGVLTTGASSSGGKELVGTVLVAPAGLLAAIAIPSFVKARNTAQYNACINNLRQIDGAKEQWAMAMRKVDGDPADVRGISQYIKGGKIPVCPQGGTYTINPIGTLPVCSIPGHQME